MSKNKIKLAAPIQPDSTVDGPGIRTVIWTQGCTHNCPQCHNPSTHDIHGGYLADIDDVCKEIKEYGQNITLSGGDPILQSESCLQIASFAKSIGLTVWLYTGYTIETLLDMSSNNKSLQALLQYVDVIVDGKFVFELKTLDKIYRGSSNQRLIDVKKTLETNQIQLANISNQSDELINDDRFAQYF